MIILRFPLICWYFLYLIPLQVTLHFYPKCASTIPINPSAYIEIFPQIGNFLSRSYNYSSALFVWNVIFSKISHVLIEKFLSQIIVPLCCTLCVQQHYYACDSFLIAEWHTFPPWRNSPCGPEPPHYQGFTVTPRHTTFGRTHLDEWSARRRALYLTTHNTHKRRTPMPIRCR